MESFSLDNINWINMGGGAVLLAGLLALSVIDWRTFRLPNRLTFPLIIAGLVYSFFIDALMSALLGAAIGYGVFVILELGYKRLRGRDGLGRGDAKMLAVGGAWCGAFALPFIVLIASAGALSLLILPSMRAKSENGQLPFGPFLSAGIFLTWIGLTLSGY
ncbi:prepilin peptidase [Robiginitomaculum antarcticum]|uniref:prepilin peptidase n=1 Tax=Robiginitomaculum antarcticum TaxID=437507 RepID=UPI0014614485|nr:A24 family peptidase [Robiginitomaculum antarcticum]